MPSPKKANVSAPNSNGADAPLNANPQPSPEDSAEANATGADQNAPRFFIVDESGTATSSQAGDQAGPADLPRLDAQTASAAADTAPPPPPQPQPASQSQADHLGTDLLKTGLKAVVWCAVCTIFGGLFAPDDFS